CIILNFVSNNFKVITERQKSSYFSLTKSWSNIISLLDFLRVNFWKLIYYHLKNEPSSLTHGNLMSTNIIKNTKVDLKEILRINQHNIKSTKQKINP
uniref:hypothetical protein n=1 Tax=Cyanothece sp. BG0011 TaxID=2082950 RepID=UPI001E3509BC